MHYPWFAWFMNIEHKTKLTLNNSKYSHQFSYTITKQIWYAENVCYKITLMSTNTYLHTYPFDIKAFCCMIRSVHQEKCNRNLQKLNDQFIIQLNMLFNKPENPFKSYDVAISQMSLKMFRTYSTYVHVSKQHGFLCKIFIWKI